MLWRKPEEFGPEGAGEHNPGSRASERLLSALKGPENLAQGRERSARTLGLRARTRCSTLKGWDKAGSNVLIV